MVSDAGEALRRLRERIRSPAVSVWLAEAWVTRAADDRVLLHVPGPFPKHWLESRHAGLLHEIFGGPVEVVAEAATAGLPRRERAVPRLRGPAGEFALRIVRAFAREEAALASMVVLHGPAHSGKSLLAEWACFLGGKRVFRLDLLRLRRGRSRGLVPRKPLVVGEGLEILAGRDVAQRTVCRIIDVVQDRGDRLLLTVEGHPGRREGLLDPLRSRLLGGVLVPVEPEDPAVLRARRGRRPAEPVPPPSDPLGRMKDVAACLFGVERALLDSATKRRSVVEARRTVMAAARYGGLESRAIASAFGLRSTRTVLEACRWAAREQDRDRRYAALLHEVARVLPKP
ncbi:MAG: hypothetical protein ACYTEZ_05235 [Planctomycetota bacterium]|jgi:chromosomal replication initiation ATPase DnaA